MECHGAFQRHSAQTSISVWCDTASVRVNGESAGRTPLPLKLKPGLYTISLTSGGTIAEYPIEVVSGGANKWCYVFETGTNHAGGCP